MVRKVHCQRAYQIILKYVTSKPWKNGKLIFPILKTLLFLHKILYNWVTMVNVPDICKNLESIILLIVRSKCIWQGCQKRSSLKHRFSSSPDSHFRNIKPYEKSILNINNSTKDLMWLKTQFMWLKRSGRFTGGGM